MMLILALSCLLHLLDNFLDIIDTGIQRAKLHIIDMLYINADECALG